MRGERFLGPAILFLHAGLLAYAGWRMSPTMDEPAHLAAGVAHWRFGRFALYAVNPPLVRMVAVLPVLAVGCEEDWSSYHSRPATRAEFPVGRDFSLANGPRIFWLTTLARWACIPFSLLGGWICWRWANELFGPPCGLVALLLWSFSPNIIAHGALLTSDVAGASFGLAATYLFWRWLRDGRWPSALWAGVMLGLSLLVKATWVILWGLWPLLWLLDRQLRTAVTDGTSSPRQRSLSREAGQLAAVFVLALYLLNAGYGFEGAGVPLGEYEFVSRALRDPDEASRSGSGNRFRGTRLGAVPLPLPQSFVLGIDAQKRDFEQGRVKYLRGRLSRDGWWYFYLYALLVKVPLGTWLLAALALLTAGGTRRGLRELLPVLSTAAALFVLVSAQTGLNYLRYLLPAFPFLFIAISHVGRSVRQPGWQRTFVVAALLGTVGSSLWVYPHSLSFMNLAAGGPRRGYLHLDDSNFDWGQDLLALRRWLDEHPQVESLKLAYFGLVDPRQAGIDFTLPPATDPPSLVAAATLRPPPGWYALSATYVYGGFGHIYDAQGKATLISPGAFGYFRQFDPLAVAGTTILIYKVGNAADP